MPSLRGAVKRVLQVGERIATALRTGPERRNEVVIAPKRPKLVEAYWEGDGRPPAGGAPPP